MEKSYSVLRLVKGFGLFQRNRDTPRAVYFSRDQADKAYHLLNDPPCSSKSTKGKPLGLHVKSGWLLVSDDGEGGNLAFWMGNMPAPLPIGVDVEAERLGKLRDLQKSARDKLTPEERVALGLPEEEEEEEPGDDSYDSVFDDDHA